MRISHFRPIPQGALAAAVVLPISLLAHQACAQPAVVTEQPSVKERADTKFLRVQRDEDGQPLRLQTAVASFVPAGGDRELVVDLVSAVHVGDKDYYQRLNKRFASYDVVLYELVAPPGTRIPRGGKRQSDNPIALLQQMSKSMLELESQTEQIDYTKKNFVHADMSPGQIAEAMRQRGETGLTLMLSVTADLMRQAKQQQELAENDKHVAARQVDPFELLMDPRRGIRLKRLMADQFAQLDSLDGGLGPTLGRMLVADRNAAATKVLRRELAQGHQRVAIFYGAAHMSDFQQRLEADFDLRLDRVRWLTAWDLTREQPDSAADPLEGLQKLFAP